MGRDILLGCLLGVALRRILLAAGAILAVLWIVAIAGYGFQTSFAGRPLFGENLLQE